MVLTKLWLITFVLNFCDVFVKKRRLEIILLTYLLTLLGFQVIRGFSHPPTYAKAATVCCQHRPIYRSEAASQWRCDVAANTVAAVQAMTCGFFLSGNPCSLLHLSNADRVYFLNAVVTCEIKLFWNNFEIISVSFQTTTSETEIKLFQSLKE